MNPLTEPTATAAGVNAALQVSALLACGAFGHRAANTPAPFTLRHALLILGCASSLGAFVSLYATDAGRWSLALFFSALLGIHHG